MKDIWPTIVLRGAKKFLITIGCLASYVILPAMLVAFILFLLALLYSIWTWAYIFLSSL